MKTKIVTEAGFIGGKYLKAGASVPDYENMTRDELLAAARGRGLTVAANTSKPDLLTMLVPPANQSVEQD